MENVTDALYMAAAIIILLVALSVSISSFSRVRADVQQIIETDQNADLAKDESGVDYINYIRSTESIRVVGIETIIPTIRKIQTKSYAVYISCNNLNTVFPTNEFPDVNIVTNNGNTYAKIATEGSSYKTLTKENMQKLYDRLKDMQFNEYVGVYSEYNENLSDANKKEHRIIIYEQTTM